MQNAYPPQASPSQTWLRMQAGAHYCKPLELRIRAPLILALVGNNRMPNFFKKLTGSLQIPEEKELFEEDLKKDENETFQQNATDNANDDNIKEITMEEEEEEELEEPAQSQPETGNETDLPQFENLGGKEEAEPQNDSVNPYTIAQLAQATTKKQTTEKSGSRVSESMLGKIKSLNKKGQGLEEKANQVEPEGQLAIDVYETESKIVIKSTIAGVNPENLDVGIEDNVVNIRGSRHNEEKTKGADYFYQECYWGTFSRSVVLPVEIEADNAEASLTNGVLTIKIPKAQREKEKKIKVVG